MAGRPMAQIKVGKFRTVLETRQYAQGVKVALPVLTAKGARPGPLAVVTANQHGRELQGIASIERAWSRIDVKKLRGTVVFLPVMNPVGARVHIQDYPVEQTRYPGQVTGLLKVPARIIRYAADGAASITEIPKTAAK